MSIGERITQLRKEKSLSQGDLAQALDVTRQAVSKWENDQSSPDTLKLIQLSQVLDTEVEYLATGRKPVYEQPIVLNMVKKVDKVVEKVVEVEKPVIKRVVRVKYRRNPMEYAAIGLGAFLLGLILGILI
ncbi:MAG: helix-turn-helix transcriptional regulator [Eubacteriales bacterium]|nr:helix-turn-helix transcriptional regulator [Eubacteriales bacterium]